MFRAFILLALCACPVAAQELKATTTTQKIEPFLDEQTLFVLRVDCSKLSPDPFVGVMANILGSKEELSMALTEIKSVLSKFKKLGGKDIFVTYGANEFPNSPVILVPINDSPEQRRDLAELVKLLIGDDEWKIIKLHECMAIGKQQPLEAMKAKKAKTRKDLIAGLEYGSNAMLQLVFAMTDDARKIHEEVAPMLPAELGGGSMTKLTRGLKWVQFMIDAEPELRMRTVVEATSPEALIELEKMTANGKNPGDILKPIINGEVEALERAVNLLFKEPKHSKDGELRQIAEWNLAASLKTFKVDLAPLPPVDRARSMNQLKQLILAMHNYHDTYQRFPTDIRDPDGKLLLSWRVELLPFLDQGQLYKQFKMNEPWDSEHNKKLIEQMPKVFKSPRQADALKGKTTYVGPSGKGFFFGQQKGFNIAKIVDGTSQTIALLECNDEDAVVWSQPLDLKLDTKNPVAKLTGHFQDGFLAAMADGSVRFFKKNMNSATFFAYLTVGNGEVIVESK